MVSQIHIYIHTPPASLTNDLLNGDGLEYEGCIDVVLVDGALDEDHPPVVLVCQEVTHLAEVPTVSSLSSNSGGRGGGGAATPPPREKKNRQWGFFLS